MELQIFVMNSRIEQPCYMGLGSFLMTFAPRPSINRRNSHGIADSCLWIAAGFTAETGELRFKISFERLELMSFRIYRRQILLLFR